LIFKKLHYVVPEYGTHVRKKSLISSFNILNN